MSMIPRVPSTTQNNGVNFGGSISSISAAEPSCQGFCQHSWPLVKCGLVSVGWSDEAGRSLFWNSSEACDISTETMALSILERIVLDPKPFHFAFFRWRGGHKADEGYSKFLKFLSFSVRKSPHPPLTWSLLSQLGEGFQCIDFIDENVLTKVSKSTQILCLLLRGEKVAEPG